MSENFEAALAKIKGFDLQSLSEQEIKQGVILPLLNRVGWDTEDVTEVVPEFPLGAGNKADYALRIGQTNRVLVEAKAGRVDLRNQEKQLEAYCRVAKPNIAVLSNGSHWWLYFRLRKDSGAIRQFHSFDTVDSVTTVEDGFRRFLSRGGLVNDAYTDKVVANARAMFRERRERAKVMKGLSDALDKLASSEELQAEIIASIIDSDEISPSEAQIREFIRTKGRLFFDSNEGADRKGQRQRHIKPASFTFQPIGKDPIVRTAHHWNELLVGVCGLMFELHPDTFDAKVLEIPKRFSTSSEDFRSSHPIGETGIYVAGGSSRRIRRVCRQVLTQFGYSPESLTIEVKD